MLMLVIQSLLLIALAYLIGCLLGCLAKRLFGSAPEEPKYVAKPKAAPKPARKAAPKPVRAAAVAPKPKKRTPDDLKLIKGIGPGLEKKLNAQGIYRFDQIAKWNQKEVDAFNTLLSFKGRIERDTWLKQAKTLAAGGQTEFSKRSKKK